MKAKLLVLFMFMFAYAYANEGNSVLLQENKTEITKEQLPETVQVAMEESEFAAWTVSQIFEVAPAEEGEANTYEIIVAGDDQSLALTFDAEGNLLKTEESSDE